MIVAILIASVVLLIIIVIAYVIWRMNQPASAPAYTGAPATTGAGSPTVTTATPAVTPTSATAMYPTATPPVVASTSTTPAATVTVPVTTMGGVPVVAATSSAGGISIAPPVSVITQTIDKVLAQLSSPTLTLAQKQVVGLPTVQQLNAAIAAALAAVPIADKTQYQALQTSLATVQKQYGLKLQQIGAMMQALKISECGNSLTTAQQLGCRVYPAQLPILGKCLPGYTKATIAGSAVGACVQGTPTGRPIYATIPSAFYR